MRKIFSDPEKDYTYQLLSDYFDHISVEKVRDEGKFSIYMAQFPCLLLNEQRFIVLMTPQDQYPPSYLRRIDELHWVSLQTRTLKNEYPDIIQQSYTLKQQSIYEKGLSIETRTSSISIYKVEDLPLKVSLLHVRGNEYEYPDEGNLVSAIETYRTIIQFTN